jgi:hypothetical protein
VCLLGSLSNARRTGGSWSSIGLVIASIGVVLLIVAFSASWVRLRIEGDQVQVVHPFLGGIRDKAFRLDEIASVEVMILQEGRKQIRIGLHNGSSVRYVPWNETEGDELLGALTWGVAEAKPAPPDWSEFA